MKIESKLNFYCEAREYLQYKDAMLTQHTRTQEKDIDQYARDLARERMDKIVKEKQQAQKNQYELKEKLRKKAERQKNFSLFKGNPQMPRSERKEFKPVVVKKAILDQQTKDEMEYLDKETFGIL